MINDAESGRITEIFCAGLFSWMGPCEGVVCGQGVETKKTSCSKEIALMDALFSTEEYSVMISNIRTLFFWATVDT